MDQLDELLAYVARDHHPDTWAEYACNYAEELIAGFSDTAWDGLLVAWPSLTLAAHARLADVLYAQTSARKFAVLEAMLLQGPPATQEAAVEALELNLPAYLPPAHLVARLRELQPTADEFTGGRIDNLLLNFHPRPRC
jgi:hypothetical protein